MEHEAGRERAPCRGMLRAATMALVVAWTGSCGTGWESVDSIDMSEIRGDPIEPWDQEVWRVEAGAGAEPDSNGTAWSELDWDDEGGLEGDPHWVSFDRLASFEYPTAAPWTGEPVESESGAGDAGIPASIRALNGRMVGVQGFMLPTRLEGGLAREFLLMRDQSMCCFGVIPRINEWIEVVMTGRGVRPLMDQPVTVFGRLHVGATYEGGILMGFYRMEGEDLAGPLDL